MIKIYGMPTCPYCAYVDEQVKGDKRFKVIDIGENVRYMSAFMHLRDKSAAFDHSKEIGDIGIPAFVLEDGTVTLKPEDVGLKEYDPNVGGPACSAKPTIKIRKIECCTRGKIDKCHEPTIINR